MDNAFAMMIQMWNHKIIATERPKMFSAFVGIER